jgi:hypothetical protein
MVGDLVDDGAAHLLGLDLGRRRCHVPRRGIVSGGLAEGGPRGHGRLADVGSIGICAVSRNGPARSAAPRLQMDSPLETRCRKPHSPIVPPARATAALVSI